jgi:hypothetical protein
MQMKNNTNFFKGTIDVRGTILALQPQIWPAPQKTYVSLLRPYIFFISNPVYAVPKSDQCLYKVKCP